MKLTRHEQFLESRKEDLPILLATVWCAVRATPLEEQYLERYGAFRECWGNFRYNTIVRYGCLLLTSVSQPGADLHAQLRFRTVRRKTVLFMDPVGLLHDHGALLTWLRVNLPDETPLTVAERWDDKMREILLDPGNDQFLFTRHVPRPIITP